MRNDLFMLKYCLHTCKTQEVCDNVFDDFLPALKLIPNWFVASEIIKKLHNALFEEDDTLFFDEDSGRVTFSSDEICNLSVDLNNINLDDVNFYEDDPENLIMSDVQLGTIDLKNKKQLKKV